MNLLENFLAEKNRDDIAIKTAMLIVRSTIEQIVDRVFNSSGHIRPLDGGIIDITGLISIPEWELISSDVLYSTMIAQERANVVEYKGYELLFVIFKDMTVTFRYSPLESK